MSVPLSVPLFRSLPLTFAVQGYRPHFPPSKLEVLVYDENTGEDDQLIGRYSLALPEVRDSHSMDCSPTRWPPITSDCDAMRLPSINWPESPRIVRPPGVGGG